MKAGRDFDEHKMVMKFFVRRKQTQKLWKWWFCLWRLSNEKRFGKFLSTYNERQDVKRKIKALSMVFLTHVELCYKSGYLRARQLTLSITVWVWRSASVREFAVKTWYVAASVLGASSWHATSSHTALIVKSSFGHKRLLHCLYTLIN